jgi:uncharacterized protein
MTAQTAWLLAIFAVVIAGVIGFFVGRQFAAGKERIEALESEVQKQQAQIEGYRKEVATHFDKTATLFVSMAGSYKELFEHLSSGYEKLSSGSARELFQQRVDALLVGNARDGGGDGKLLTAAGVAAAGAAVAGAAASSTAGEGAAPAPEGVVDTLVEADEALAQTVADEGRIEPAAALMAEVAEGAAPASATIAEPRAEASALADDPLAEEVLGHHPTPPRNTPT